MSAGVRCPVQRGLIQSIDLPRLVWCVIGKEPVTKQEIIAEVAFEPVKTAATRHRVIAALAKDQLGARGAVQPVRGIVARHDRAVPARKLVDPENTVEQLDELDLVQRVEPRPRRGQTDTAVVAGKEFHFVGKRGVRGAVARARAANIPVRAADKDIEPGAAHQNVAARKTEQRVVAIAALQDVVRRIADALRAVAAIDGVVEVRADGPFDPPDDQARGPSLIEMARQRIERQGNRTGRIGIADRVDLVRVGAAVADAVTDLRIGGRRARQVQIVARPAQQPVRSRAAVQRVIAAVALQKVVAVVSDKKIVAVITGKGVRIVVADHHVLERREECPQYGRVVLLVGLDQRIAERLRRDIGQRDRCAQPQVAFQ